MQNLAMKFCNKYGGTTEIWNAVCNIMLKKFLIDSDNFILISSKVENLLGFGYQVNSVLNIYIVNHQTQISSHPHFPNICNSLGPQNQLILPLLGVSRCELFLWQVNIFTLAKYKITFSLFFARFALFFTNLAATMSSF